MKPFKRLATIRYGQLMLTTWEADQDRQKAQPLRANKFTTKPLDWLLMGQLITWLGVDWLKCG